MFKTIFTLICLGGSFACLGDGFNEEALKNPPKNIEFIDFKDGDIGYGPKQYYYDIEGYGILGIHPCLLRINGVYECQIRIYSTKGYPQNPQLKLSSEKIINLKIKSKNIQKRSFGNAYYIICKLNLQDYIDCFVKDMPIGFQIEIPEISNDVLSFKIDKDWKKSFGDMKVFFKVDPEK